MEPFKGFTQDQQFKLLTKMGYKGSNDSSEMSKFLESSPSVATKMGKWAEKASERLSKLRGYAEGGLAKATGESWRDRHERTAANNEILANRVDVNKQWEGQSSTNSGSSQSSSAQGNTSGSTTATPSTTTQNTSTSTTSTTGSEEGAIGGLSPQEQQDLKEQSKELTDKAVSDPSSLVTPANVDKIAQDDNQLIAEGTGQDTTEEKANVSTVEDTATATTPKRTDANTFDATKTQDSVKAETDSLEAATAEPSSKATVQGQLESLMADFEGGGTPPWASGSMRNAMALMQQRGMGASSMAGQAVVQAAMESAISIASQDAQTNAQFEMQNLNNQQQTSIFKTQQNIASLFTDQAADNAAKQFNAASKNQVDQFFADLESVTSRFNTDQINSIMQFNAGQENAIEQFNKSLKAARDQFNAGNDLIIAQANAKWRQTTSLTDTQAQNDANMVAAQTASGFTSKALDQIWQKERDIMAFAFKSSENSEDRATELLLADKDINAQKDEAKTEAIGYIAGKLLFG